MKSPINLIALTSAAVIAAALTFFAMPRQALAAPITTEQYKIVDLGSGSFSSSASIETHLNRLGDEGWRVRASVGNFVIVAK